MPETLLMNARQIEAGSIEKAQVGRERNASQPCLGSGKCCASQAQQGCTF